MHWDKILIFSILNFLIGVNINGQGLTIQSGTHLVLNGNAALVVNDGSFINNGAFNSGMGTVYMIGTVPTASTKIGGSSSLSFNDLVIDKTSNGVQLEADLTFFPANTLQMLSGNLDLNGKDIFLFSGATILSESETNRIMGDSGRIVTTTNLNGPTNVNPGNIGLSLSSTDNLGTFTIERIHGVQTINGSQSNQRYYKIKYFNTGLTVDYTLQYFNAELNGINEAYLDSWKYDTNWKQRTANALDTMTNIVTVNGASEQDTLWALSTGQLRLSPKVLLSGAYDTGGLMKDDLRTFGVIPTTEPFTALGFNLVNCSCDSTTQSVLSATGNDAIVDWMLVELRLRSNQDSVLQSVAALLQKDGDVVDIDGVSAIKIPNLSADSFYVAVKHRNHLGVISTDIRSLTPIASTYDFSTNISNTKGGNLGIKDLGDGYYALYSGDADMNGQVQNSDGTALVLKLGSAGYMQEDLDMNGQVQNTDLTNEQRPNLGKGVQFNN